jgi:hypothetical protein
VDARDERPGGPVLEVRQVQPQEVPEHLASEHRVHSVAGVDQEVLAQPTHARIEGEEHRKAHGDGDQRALGLVDHHLVDHDLRAKGRREADELDEEGRRQHVAPDALVLEELGPEPAEAKLRPLRCAVLRRGLDRLVLQKDNVRREAFAQRGERRGLGCLTPGDEIEKPLGVALDEDRRARLLAREKSDAGERGLREFALAGSESKRAERFDELPEGMRCGITLQQQRRVERHPVDLAKAADQPGKVRFSERRGQPVCHTPPSGEPSEIGLGCHLPAVI